MPAISPLCSASLPSVADTCDSEISFRLIGSAPRRNSLARSWAEVIVKLPEMSAPLSPLIPSGYCLKSMYGTVISWLSSATAKCWRSVWPRPLTRSPRWAMFAVTAWNWLLPLPLKPNVTSGEPVFGSVLCWGFVISLPRSATSSLSTKNWALGSLIGVCLEKFAGIAWRTTVPRGTSRIWPSDALTPAGSPDTRASLLSSGPFRRQC